LAAVCHARPDMTASEALSAVELHDAYQKPYRLVIN
jgi:hypothetical protein